MKGLCGFIALLLPLAFQTLLVLADAVRRPRGRLPFAIVITLILLSFGENLEIEACMLWPGLLLLLGIHAAEMRSGDPARGALGVNKTGNSSPAGSRPCVRMPSSWLADGRSACPFPVEVEIWRSDATLLGNLLLPGEISRA